jgi:predicted DNA-binding WGR domain protein
MTPAITLFRTDPARNMLRYYRLDVQRDLFGAGGLMREWGRIGRSGQISTMPYADEPEAATPSQRAPRLLAAMKVSQGKCGGRAGARKRQQPRRHQAVRRSSRLP